MYLLLNAGLIAVCYLYMKIEPRIREKQRKYIILILNVVASVLFAFRPVMTKDTAGYIDAFEQVGNFSGLGFSFLQKYQGYEYGYIYLMKIFRLFSNNYRCFFFIISFIGLWLAIYSLCFLTNKCWIGEENRILSGGVLTFYIANFGFLYNGISVRAGLTLGLGLLAIVRLINKKYIRGMLLFIIAFSIQRTSILFVAIYLVIKFIPALKQKAHLVLWAISGAMLFSGFGNWGFTYIGALMDSLFTKYSISGYSAFLQTLDTSIGLRDVYMWLLYGFLVVISDNRKYIQKYLNVVMIGVLVIVFLHGVRAIARVYDMFFLFSIPLMASYYYRLGNHKQNVFYKYKDVGIAALVCMNAILMLRLSFY